MNARRTRHPLVRPGLVSAVVVAGERAGTSRAVEQVRALEWPEDQLEVVLVAPPDLGLDVGEPRSCRARAPRPTASPRRATSASRRRAVPTSRSSRSMSGRIPDGSSPLPIRSRRTPAPPQSRARSSPRTTASSSPVPRCRSRGSRCSSVPVNGSTTCRTPRATPCSRLRPRWWSTPRPSDSSAGSTTSSRRASRWPTWGGACGCTASVSGTRRRRWSPGARRSATTPKQVSSGASSDRSA